MSFHFIKTSDEDTKNALVNEGFKLIAHEGSMYTFLNDKAMKFSDTNKKITYSNMLCI